MWRNNEERKDPRSQRDLNTLPLDHVCTVLQPTMQPSVGVVHFAQIGLTTAHIIFDFKISGKIESSLEKVIF